MAYGIIGFSAPGAATQPSPAIWSDCSSQELLDEGTGFFTYKEFTEEASLPGLPQASAGAAGTYIYNTAYDSVLNITTSGTAAYASMIFTRPLGPVASNSGKKFWAEICVAIDHTTTALNGGTIVPAGWFFGLVGGPSLVTGVSQPAGLPVTAATADAKAAVVTAVSATRTSNTITTKSLIGIVATPTGTNGQTKLDALYLNQPTYSATATALPATTSTVTTIGTPVYIQTDLLNSTSITANLNSALATSTTTTSAGVVTQNINGFPGDLTSYQPTPNTTLNLNNGFVKLGIYYDGQRYLYFFVNGVQAAKKLVDGTFDQTTDYGVVFSITNAGAQAQTAYVDFIRAAAKVY